MSREEGRSVIGRVLAVATLAQIVVAALTGAVSGTFRARAEVRDVAEDVVREQWLATLRTETSAIALAAAREAADRAVRESLTPAVMDFRAHVAQDDERQRRTDDEIREFKRRGGR